MIWSPWEKPSSRKETQGLRYVNLFSAIFAVFGALCCVFYCCFLSDFFSRHITFFWDFGPSFFEVLEQYCFSVNLFVFRIIIGCVWLWSRFFLFIRIFGCGDGFRFVTLGLGAKIFIFKLDAICLFFSKGKRFYIFSVDRIWLVFVSGLISNVWKEVSSLIKQRVGLTIWGPIDF